MAGGFKVFGPTYNATKYVRVLHEGMINGNHDVDVTGLNGEEDLAGKVASIGADGVTLANKGVGAVGLFVEDFGDMVNASGKASFYFRGGEYAVSVDRMGANASAIVAGDQLTTDATGKIVKLTDASTETAIGVATTKAQPFTMGNMFEHAGLAANGGNFVQFILYM